MTEENESDRAARGVESEGLFGRRGLAGEVRTTSSTGGEKGVKPVRFDLLPVGPLTRVAELYAKGAAKYADHNWRRGYEWSKSYAALMRHLTQFWDGQDNDDCEPACEMPCSTHTGLPHMTAVVFHAFALLEFMERFPEFDDRFKPDVPIVPPCGERYELEPGGVLLCDKPAGHVDAGDLIHVDSTSEGRVVPPRVLQIPFDMPADAPFRPQMLTHD